MITKELSIKHHGRTVYGKCNLPEKLDQFPMVIFSHGYNGNMYDYEDLAKHYAQNGIGTVFYNFCGGSIHDNSGFPTTEMTIYTEMEDLTAVINTILDWKFVYSEKLFLFGESMGGLVSALTANYFQSNICGLILLYPALCIADDWRDQFPQEKDIPESEELWGITLGKNFFTSIRQLNVFDEIKNFNKNVLIMHGEEDSVVPIQYSFEAKKIYQKAKLELFENEGHGFSKEGKQKVKDMTLLFIQQCIEYF